MLLTLPLTILFLVAVNFLLLKFSCNKTPKRNKVSKKPIILKPIQSLEQETRLAPTGS